MMFANCRLTRLQFGQNQASGGFYLKLNWFSPRPGLKQHKPEKNPDYQTEFAYWIHTLFNQYEEEIKRRKEEKARRREEAGLPPKVPKTSNNKNAAADKEKEMRRFLKLSFRLLELSNNDNSARNSGSSNTVPSIENAPATATEENVQGRLLVAIE